jgi:hypothetical protein
MLVYFQDFDFHAIISAACFGISFSIPNCLSSFRNTISSFCSGMRLSLALNEPLLPDWLIQRSKADGVKPYSLNTSLHDFLLL